jgi:hypothetical protein
MTESGYFQLKNEDYKSFVLEGRGATRVLGEALNLDFSSLEMGSLVLIESSHLEDSPCVFFLITKIGLRSFRVLFFKDALPFYEDFQDYLLGKDQSLILEEEENACFVFKGGDEIKTFFQEKVDTKVSFRPFFSFELKVLGRISQLLCLNPKRPFFLLLMDKEEEAFFSKKVETLLKKREELKHLEAEIKEAHKEGGFHSPLPKLFLKALT